MEWLHRDFSLFLVCTAIFLFTGCSDNNPPDPPESSSSTSEEIEVSPEFQKGVQQEPFGDQSADEEIDRFVLSNDHGMQVAITNQGGIVLSIEVPIAKEISRTSHLDSKMLKLISRTPPTSAQYADVMQTASQAGSFL